MPNRNYSSIAGVMQLVSPATSATTTIEVDATGGLPVVPFTLVLDPGNASEEIVTCTSVSGGTLTVTRAEDDTAAVSHAAGSTVRHMFTARDATEFAAHMDATEEVHGLELGAALVGTTTGQTLTNKSMSGADNSFSDIPGTAIDAASIPDSALAPGIDADTVGGRKFFVQSGTPTHSGPAGSAIWFVTS